jgi:hypothetical protein
MQSDVLGIDHEILACLDFVIVMADAILTINDSGM